MKMTGIPYQNLMHQQIWLSILSQIIQLPVLSTLHSTKAVLGFSTTNDSSQAIYDDNINYATIESGANTRTVNFSSSELYSGPYLVPVNGKKYYFWLKVTSAANNVRESAWSNVAEFTYTK